MKMSSTLGTAWADLQSIVCIFPTPSEQTTKEKTIKSTETWCTWDDEQNFMKWWKLNVCQQQTDWVMCECAFASHSSLLTPHGVSAILLLLYMFHFVWLLLLLKSIFCIASKESVFLLFVLLHSFCFVLGATESDNRLRSIEWHKCTDWNIWMPKTSTKNLLISIVPTLVGM